MGDLSEHFSKAEFRCHCGCGADSVSSDLVLALESLRQILNEPIHVLSGVRCQFHNAKVGGVKNSQHLEGTAADIYIDSLSPKHLADYIENHTHIVFGGLGIYPTFIHVDVRQGKARWKQ